MLSTDAIVRSRCRRSPTRLCCSCWSRCSGTRGPSDRSGGRTDKLAEVIDTFDHLKAQDLRQTSVVLAGVLLQVANSAKTLPRMPVPTKGTPTNPFKYDAPDDE